MSGVSKKEIGPYMQGILDQLGLSTLTELSRDSGIPRSTLDRYAFGLRMPTLPHATTLARLTSRPVDAVMKGFAKEFIDAKVSREFIAS